MERGLKILAVISSVLVFLVVVGGALLYIVVGDDLIDFGRRVVLQVSLAPREEDLNRPMGDDPTPLRFLVQSGDTALSIGHRLQAEGFINDADLFRDYARLERLDTELEAGTYFLNQTMSIREIAHALTDSRFSQIVFTVFPGQRLEQVVDAVERNPYFAFTSTEFLQLVGRGTEVTPEFITRVGFPSGASLEGFLYPDTYSLPPETTPQMLRDTLLDAFFANVDDTLITQTNAQGYTLYEIVTLASIIEREAVHAEEQALIASVYRNRLETPGWRLDADPTVQYPLGEPGSWWPTITRADYQGVQSSYNTYVHQGLPPGPIASPAIGAIRAAINPEPSGYFFFRADCRNDGYHDFSVTYEEHNNLC